MLKDKKLIHWNDSLSVGVESIDREHMALVSIINELFEAILDCEHHTGLKKIFLELDDYVLRHFSHEERLLEKYGFPDASDHEEQHHLLIRKLRELEAALGEQDSYEAQAELMNFLREWFREHLIESDQKYIPFLKSKGVK